MNKLILKDADNIIEREIPYNSTKYNGERTAYYGITSIISEYVNTTFHLHLSDYLGISGKTGFIQISYTSPATFKKVFKRVSFTYTGSLSKETYLITIDLAEIKRKILLLEEQLKNDKQAREDYTLKEESIENNRISKLSEVNAQLISILGEPTEKDLLVFYEKPDSPRALKWIYSNGIIIKTGRFGVIHVEGILSIDTVGKLKVVLNG
jgi:hypothetical protein